MSLVTWFCWGQGAGDLWDPWRSWGLAPAGNRDRDDVSALALVDVDWRETDKAHIFRADLPGVRKEGLKVQVEEWNVLQIRGERVREEVDKNDKWHRVERHRGSFVRRFRLPENASMVEIKCALKDGVLEVIVPQEGN